MRLIERKFAWPTRFPTSPNKGRATGSVGQIYRMVKSMVGDGIGWVDPMCGKSVLCEIRNDFRDQRTSANSNMDALEFLKSLEPLSANGVVYDPPYNDLQGLKYSKKNISKSNLRYWWDMRKEISRILKPGAVCIMLNWNSNVLPHCTIEQVTIFAHGSERHDTILTVQRKKQLLL